MKILTVCNWDDKLWQDALPLYLEAFGNKGAKPTKIIKNMFAKGIAELHLGYNISGVVVMALTGKLVSEGVMIIDYLAVSEKERGRGLGKHFVDYIRQKAVDQGYEKLIIEAESEETTDNKRRIDFWQSCGFLLTEYVHHYIWVPETYHAMYLPLIADSREVNGEELFVYINTFHRLSFRRGGGNGG
ncbi:GNAT family N-acetyltransferase [Alkalihalobacterium chitinilyticum]|uniref:GNAT family N-acetyltransferase n=1 Tax=Alkalihalobacterium chitinilyticum TaxID=2980103 RepID=A0ABT5VEV3_9BACI|nr:GNAT family N-acetyltransferase [Alkalihalobacterium chitinilyticum]MDE5413991.1 GNAT family N-acetyltransferase [Alkalihalobacterium chitinilyticum]